MPYLNMCSVFLYIWRTLCNENNNITLAWDFFRLGTNYYAFELEILTYVYIYKICLFFVFIQVKIVIVITSWPCSTTEHLKTIISF